jgi:hypothetical protein
MEKKSHVPNHQPEFLFTSIPIGAYMPIPELFLPKTVQTIDKPWYGHYHGNGHGFFNAQTHR